MLEIEVLIGVKITSRTFIKDRRHKNKKDKQKHLTIKV
jgi:hypothetical protein